MYTFRILHELCLVYMVLCFVYRWVKLPDIKVAKKFENMLCLYNFLIDSDEKSTVIVLFCFLKSVEMRYVYADQTYIMRREILCLKMLTFMDIWKHRKFIWIAFYPLQYKLFYVSKIKKRKPTQNIYEFQMKNGGKKPKNSAPKWLLNK